MALVAGRRENLRAATVREIKAVARREIARGGAHALTLSAVARGAGLSQPGLYRYFANRDDLLTALVADGYDALAAAVEAVVDPAAPPADQFRAVALAYRERALTDPVDFGLVFGAPVPAYHAPLDGPTVPSAARLARVVLGVLDRADAEGLLPDLPPAEPPVPVAAHLAGRPDRVVAHFLAAWGRVHGLVCLEVFGHLGLMLPDPAAAFRHQVEVLLDQAGLRDRTR
jgi:AcrR family transcriptional regulator